MPRSSDAAFLMRLRDAAREPDPYRAALLLAVEHFAADSGTIHLLRGSALELVAHTPLPPPVLEVIRVVPVGKGMAGLAVERCAPVTACNLQTDTSGDVRPGARATGLKGSIVVPLLCRDGESERSGAEHASAEHPARERPAREHPVGTLGIANAVDRVFDEAEVALLMEAGRALARFGVHATTRSDAAPPERRSG